MGRYLKLALPVVILIVGVIVARQLLVHSPKAERKTVVTQAPLVQTLRVQPQDVRIPVYSQGTVTPRISINLASEVTGRIIDTASFFANGGFFKKGDVLLRINPSDYELAITKAEALVASAKQQLARAEAEYKQKLEEYKGVDRSKITDYALRKPQYEEAKANLKAATADLDLTKVQLERCNIRAPFDGRIVEKKADLGQYVTPGSMLATIHAIDVAEVRLPLSQAQMNLLDLSKLNARGNSIPALLTGTANGQLQTWQSQVVRTEAIIDERNRLQYVVAQVVNPYGLSPSPNPSNMTTPLSSGIFVEAKIEGRLFNAVYKLPRIAIHGDNQVWLLTEDNRLSIRNVTLVHRGEDNAYVKSGLQPNDTVITSPLEAVVDGMKLRTEPTANTSVSNKGA